MNALPIVQIIFAIATIATGLVSLAVPRSVRGFTGLDVSNARGITEIRAILGGAFIGLGAAPLIFHILEGYTFAHVAYQTLGITYLTIFVVPVTLTGSFPIVELGLEFGCPGRDLSPPGPRPSVV